MTGNDLKNSLLAATFVVPTGSLDGWKQLQFNKIPANAVTIESESKIKVVVNKSASPLIYKLPEIKKVSALELSFDVRQSKKQAETIDIFPEDFFLRLGLVAKGEKTLNWLQRKIAANWVLELFKLAPEGVGLDRIYFFNIGGNPKQVGKVREHPKSDLMIEEIIGSFPEQKKVSHSLKRPLEVVALWISIDGDDSQSEFETWIESISLKP